MATISERLRRDTSPSVIGNQTFDVSMSVPQRELRHEAADVIDALVAALEESACDCLWCDREPDRQDMGCRQNAALALARNGG